MKTKRFFDIVFSAAAIIVLLPLMRIVCAVIFFDDGCPVIFKQDRVGKGGKIFKVKKFRTMKNGTRTAAKKDLKEAADVITRSGRFIRKTSIDELPQLFNILEGNMSFVGPRPLIPQEKGIHELRLACGVYRVCPGMTGLAQISGRDMISHEEIVKFDKEYVENIGVLYDLKILAKTVKTVLKGENVVEGNQLKEEKKS